MSGYSIGEVCRALGVKPHIVRYWEQEIGMLSPGKDLAGRRVYTMADVQLLSRIKYLVQERHFTVKGAAEQILSERSGGSPDAQAEIGVVRAELLKLLGRVRGSTDATDTQGDE